MAAGQRDDAGDQEKDTEDDRHDPLVGVDHVVTVHGEENLDDDKDQRGKGEWHVRKQVCSPKDPRTLLTVNHPTVLTQFSAAGR